MEFIVDKEYMLHEGGTKFYQVLRIKTFSAGFRTGFDTPKVVTVTHWSPQKGEPGEVRIKSCGDRQLHAADKYGEAIKVKTKRGYQRKTEWGTTMRVDISRLDDLLSLEFDREDHAKVKTILGIDAPSFVDPSEDVDHSPAVAAARAAKVTEKPAAAAALDEWGDF